MQTLSAHSGADFEAGRTGLPRGEYLEGVAVNDRREHLPSGSANRSPVAAPAGAAENTLQQMMRKRGSDEATYQNGRKQRMKKVAEGKVIKYNGAEITIFNSELGEDERWCHVTKINDNGTKRAPLRVSARQPSGWTILGTSLRRL